MSWQTVTIFIPGFCTEMPQSDDIVRCPFKRGETGAELSFHYSIIGNFIVYRDRIEKTLLQLFALPWKSEWSSIISVIIFEVDIVAERKQA